MRRQLTLLTLVVGLGFGMQVSAQWSPTTPLSFFGDIPINSSTVLQTKTGNLTVNGGYISGATADTDLVVNGQICWNATCKNGWSSVGSGNFVHLFTSPIYTPDSGYPFLTGNAADSNTTLTARAGFPSPFGRTVTYGVFGKASSAAGVVTSVGVFAESANPYGYAVYGDVGANTTAYAGTFNGNVRITAPYDLIVGASGANTQLARTSTSAPYFGTTTSYLCLGDSAGQPFSSICKSAWDSGSSSLWTLSGNTLWPSSYAYSVAAGGNGLTAKFLIDPHPDYTTDVAVSGTTTTSGMVVGSPTGFVPVSATCGDTICNGSEVETFGHPNFCAPDCDHTPPEPDTIAVNRNNTNRTVTFTIIPEIDDSKGVVILQKINSPSTSLTDGTVVANLVHSACSPTCQYTSPSLPVNVTYYYTFFTYDYAPNYATPVSQLVRFNSGGGPPPPPPPQDG